ATAGAAPRRATPAGWRTSPASGPVVALTCCGISAGWAGSRPRARRRSPGSKASTPLSPSGSGPACTGCPRLEPARTPWSADKDDPDPADDPDPDADRSDPGAGGGLLPALRLDQLRRRRGVRLRLGHRLAGRLDRAPLRHVLAVRRVPGPGGRQADGIHRAVPDRAGPPDRLDGAVGGGHRRP